MASPVYSIIRDGSGSVIRLRTGVAFTPSLFLDQMVPWLVKGLIQNQTLVQNSCFLKYKIPPLPSISLLPFFPSLIILILITRNFNFDRTANFFTYLPPSLELTHANDQPSLIAYNRKTTIETASSTITSATTTSTMTTSETRQTHQQRHNQQVYQYIGKNKRYKF